jgi:fatty acid desaturase
MAPVRCPRCGAAVPDNASACAGCARPVTLDLTARVPKKQKRPSRKLLWRDGVLLAGGAGGIAAASTSESWWLAGGIVVGAAAIAAVLHYTHHDD